MFPVRRPTRMKCLSIQIQPQLCGLPDVAGLVDTLVANARSHSSTVNVSVTTGDDNGPYTNINIDSDDVAQLWTSIRRVIINDSALSAGAIACCEGDNGWDDYLLLYHFDNSESIDAIS